MTAHFPGLVHALQKKFVYYVVSDAGFQSYKFCYEQRLCSTMQTHFEFVLFLKLCLLNQRL